MVRYDMTGIGINLKEVPDENGPVKLKVLGLILDGPAHTAGVRQGDEVLAVNGVDVRGKSAFEASSLLQGPNETFVTIKVKYGNCGPVQSLEVQRQVVARTPELYRLERIENSVTSVGYVRLKEFNSLLRKDLLIGKLLTGISKKGSNIVQSLKLVKVKGAVLYIDVDCSSRHLAVGSDQGVIEQLKVGIKRVQESVNDAVLLKEKKDEFVDLLYHRTPKEVVARGRVLSKDPSKIVNGMKLCDMFWEIVIGEIVKKTTVMPSWIGYPMAWNKTDCIPR